MNCSYEVESTFCLLYMLGFERNYMHLDLDVRVSCQMRYIVFGMLELDEMCTETTV